MQVTARWSRSHEDLKSCFVSPQIYFALWVNPTYLISSAGSISYFLLHSLYVFSLIFGHQMFPLLNGCISEAIPGFIHTWKSTCLLLLVLSFTKTWQYIPFCDYFSNFKMGSKYLPVSLNKNESSLLTSPWATVVTVQTAVTKEHRAHTHIPAVKDFLFFVALSFVCLCCFLIIPNVMSFGHFLQNPSYRSRTIGIFLFTLTYMTSKSVSGIDR